MNGAPGLTSRNKDATNGPNGAPGIAMTGAIGRYGFTPSVDLVRDETSQDRMTKGRERAWHRVGGDQQLPTDLPAVRLVRKTENPQCPDDEMV